MKTRSTLTLLLTAAAFAITPAYADLLIYEPFNYTPGSPIIGQTNLVTSPTAIWYQAGTNGTTVHQVAAGSLSGLAFSQGNQGNPKGGDFTEMGRMGLGTQYSISNGVSYTLYYSLLLNVPSTTGLTVPNSNVNANNDIIIGFNNNAGTGARPNTWAGELVIRQGSTAGTYNLGIRASITTAGTTYFSPDLASGGTHVVVAQYISGTTGGTGGTNNLWLDPDPSTFGAASPPTPTGSSLGTYSTGAANDHSDSLILGAGIAAHSVPDDVNVDEIRVGGTWADVTSTNVPVRITTQPNSARALVGGQATFSVSTVFATTFQWQHNGSSIGTGTQNSLTLNNIQPSDAGTYDVLVGNGNGTPLASRNVTLTVFPDIYPRLAPLWSVAPGSRPYITTDAGSAPTQRGIAYNALSNQVLVVSRTNSMTGATNAAIYVLNANSGADLYQMNADPNVIKIGINNNAFTLNYIDVADDGAVVAGNIGDYTTALFKLYDWTNSDANTEPVEVWSGDPSANAPQRFGDYFAVRGAGANTQVLLDSQTGKYGALLMPTVGNNVTDPDSWSGNGMGGYAWFNNAAGGQTGGRTLIFNDSSGSTFWEKHGSGAFNLVGFDATTTNGSVILTNFANVTGGPGQIAFNATSNVLVGIVFASSADVPDTLVQYEWTDPTQPILVQSYNFPVNHQANANGCGRVIFAGDKVYALDSNNGLAAWTLVPVLHIVPDPSNVVLSWSSETPGYTLKATPSLTPPATWTNVSTGTLVGNQYFVTNSAGAPMLFYRLQK